MFVRNQGIYFIGVQTIRRLTDFPRLERFGRGFSNHHSKKLENVGVYSEFDK